MKAVLVMFKADGKRREFPLKPGTHAIGRQKTCKLRIPLPSVSRRHAELIVTEEGEVTVRDLGSSNGTFRNGSRVEEAVLEPGDELRIGPLDLILADADAVEPPEKAASSASSTALPGDDDEDAADSGAFLLDADDADPDADDSAASVSSANPLDLSGSDSGSGSAMAIDLDGDDEDAPAPEASPEPAASAAPEKNADPPAPAVDDEDEDLDDLLANFGKSDGDDESEDFDFLADVEILDDDDEKQ